MIHFRRLKSWEGDTLWRNCLLQAEPLVPGFSSYRSVISRKWKKTHLPFWTTETRGWWNLVTLAKVIVKEIWIHTCEVGVVWGIDEIVRKGLRHIFIQIQFLRWNDSVFFSTQIAHKAIHWYLSWKKWRVKKNVNVFFLWVAGIMVL